MQDQEPSRFSSFINRISQASVTIDTVKLRNSMANLLGPKKNTKSEDKKPSASEVVVVAVPLPESSYQSLVDNHSGDEGVEQPGSIQDDPLQGEQQKASVPQSSLVSLFQQASSKLSNMLPKKREVPPVVVNPENAETAIPSVGSVASYESFPQPIGDTEEYSLGVDFGDSNIVVRDNRSAWDRLRDRVGGALSNISFSRSSSAGVAQGDSDETVSTESPRLEQHGLAKPIDEIRQRMDSLNQDILDATKLITPAILEVDRYVNETVAKKLDSISDGVFLTGPSAYTQKHILGCANFYQQAQEITDKDMKQRAVKIAVDKASERWWNWGPLKLLQYVIPSYKAALNKLATDTQDYFESSLAAEELKIQVAGNERASFNQNFERYKKCFNGEINYIKPERFNFIFGKHDEIKELGSKVWKLEEVVRIDKKLSELEGWLERGERDQYREDFQEDRFKYISQRSELAKQIWDEQQVKVPPIDSKYDPSKEVPRKQLTEQEQLQQHYGDLADLNALRGDVDTTVVGLSK